MVPADFDGTIVYKDMQKRKAEGKMLGVTGFIVQFRNMLIEFGPAEYLDSFAIRPFYLSFLPFVIPSYSLAILIGTVLADITYFIPTIISYEFRKKTFKD